jgi:hypothetical protein
MNLEAYDSMGLFDGDVFVRTEKTCEALRDDCGTTCPPVTGFISVTSPTG